MISKKSNPMKTSKIMKSNNNSQTIRFINTDKLIIVKKEHRKVSLITLNNNTNKEITIKIIKIKTTITKTTTNIKITTRIDSIIRIKIISNKIKRKINPMNPSKALVSKEIL